ncbi:putative spermidine/putrescine transport system permease protein [Dongia mobilis]|uniref:Putative spermidine/putrescine transport system permease protein n=1 Tax=Dongia mobilis TaxID=578943 RepID=A0A4V3DE66_9PROT|nr:ABC transporter permease [Dongia mobilis]TDQ78925.1 putative spermidine/putrescine transport system permease protein [Dongia mobilis]
MLNLPPYASPLERLWRVALILLCAMVLLYLISPIIAIMPLSFNSEPYFTYPMPGLSMRWYEDFFTDPRWLDALKSSLIIAISATALSMVLGTLAALGLAKANFPYRAWVMAFLISPMIVPVVITAVGMYFFFANLGLNNTYFGIILAHTALATPFVVITVTATLIGFDQSLNRAGASLGAPPLTVFRKITLPLILPGMISGALFAFITSFDEVVVVLFIASPDQRTLPRQMFSGIREQISPTITAAATMLVLTAAAMLVTVELLRRRSERLRGIRS